jgi:hypothetical protein
MSRKSYIRVETRPGNILFQGLGIVLGLLALMAAVIVGGFLLAALIGVGLIGWLFIYLRIWWLTRKAGKSDGQTVGQPPGQKDIVDAEYTVITTTSERDESDN